MVRTIFCLFIFTVLLSFTIFAQTNSLTGIVKDPKGAVIADAQVSLRNEITNDTRTDVTDKQGKFSLNKLPAGNYVLTISRSGFQPSAQKIVIDDKPQSALEIKLSVAEIRGEVTTSGSGSIKPNTDPNYRALRDGVPGETFTVNNVTIKRDVGTFTFKSGRISFLPPVLNRVAIGVFVGEGEFTLAPYPFPERDYIKMVTKQETVIEQLNRVVFVFSDDTYNEIKKQGQASGFTADSQILDALRDVQNRLRNAERGGGENIEAEILTDLYGAHRPPSFNAFINGKKHKDFRFHVRPYGALDCEETLLNNADRLAEDSGYWYSSHLVSEFEKGVASSDEDKRVIDAKHYRIETVIKGEKLTASTELTFTSFYNGERVLPFALLPELRVSRVSLDDKEVNFIQEDKKKDGSLYVILSEPLVKDRQYKILIEYQGDKVLQDAGGGNFAVDARTNWYANVNIFKDRATFDLTFKIPKQYVLVSVGKKEKEWKEDDFAASQWVSQTPLAVAGFNYGKFKIQEITDEQSKYKIEGYAVSEMPDGLRNTGIGGMAPTRLLGQSLAEAQNGLRIFTHYFGALPYGRIAITQQPQVNFGQSWPSLVYMPLVSYMDSTQRWMLTGTINAGLNEFVDEVNSHEVAHQWWGHIVGWSTYHDQWLSEGFAFFSAGLYLKMTDPKPDKFLNYWRHAQEEITKKNEFGLRATDVAPVWMGWRGGFQKYRNAYQITAYRKGGFVLHMLRQMMWDTKEGDKAFIAMMQDFVKSNYNENASTEGFLNTVNKHMTPRMDIAGTKNMVWFFTQWVYGKEVPRYKLEYNLTPQSDGKTLLKFTLTQSEVSQNFAMLVPVYLEFDGKIMLAAQVPVAGSSTTKEFQLTLPQRPKRVLINYNYDVLNNGSESVEK